LRTSGCATRLDGMARARLAGFKTEGSRERYTRAYNRTLDAAGVDVHQHDVPTRFGATHVLEVGKTTSPPLVLLHTMSFSSTVWARNLAEFSVDRRVLAIDTIGDINLSRSSRKVAGRNDYVEWFTDVLASFGIATAAIVGNSYGGWLGANFSLLRPDLVSSLVLISPPLVFAKYKAAFWAHLFSAAFVRSEKSAERFARWFATNSTFADPVARSWLEQFSIGMPFFAGMNSFPRPAAFSDDELRSIARPILVIEGEQEPMHDPQASILRAREMLSDVRTELIPGTKHLAELEQPDRVNDLVLTFLDSV
jgi:pimeloyl-ACP methyl ester carboxylesterase